MNEKVYCPHCNKASYREEFEDYQSFVNKREELKKQKDRQFMWNQKLELFYSPAALFAFLFGLAFVGVSAFKMTTGFVFAVFCLFLNQEKRRQQKSYIKSRI